MWPGLPDYGARLVRAYLEASTDNVALLATKPAVPIEGMEESLGRKIYWIDPEAGLEWHDLKLPVPDVTMVGGWITPSFTKLAAAARSRGAKSILLCDNAWHGGFKHTVIDPIRHRLLFHRRFDAALVPGTLGRKYLERMGYDGHLIHEGLYGADPVIFSPGPPLEHRPKTFLFIGQLIERKNVITLTSAFLRMANIHPEWRLRICGSGQLRDQIPSHPQISVEGFVQPRQLNELMHSARCLTLPSLTDNWPLVVVEAAASGMALALSRTIGNSVDLARPENSVSFAARSEASIENALVTLANWTTEQWRVAHHTSLRAATSYGPKRFASEVIALLNKLTADQS